MRGQVSARLHGDAVPGGAVAAAKDGADGNKEKLFKNVSKNDSYIGMVEHAMKSGFDIVRVLEDVCLGVRDA
jgi:hypothetical protein